MLLKIGTGIGSPEVFETVAGLRLRQFQLNAETVDVTNTESSGRWRELLAAASTRSVTVSGSGLFKDEASDERVRASFFDQLAPNWELTLPDFGTITGPFQITSLEYSGPHDGAMAFSLTLQSAGAVVFAAETP